MAQNLTAHEIYADSFALDLLLPEKQFREYAKTVGFGQKFLKISKKNYIAKINKLASIFAVEPILVEQRLRNLEIVTPKQVHKHHENCTEGCS